MFKNRIPKNKGNATTVLAFAGTLADDEALTIQNNINLEFSKIEGDEDTIMGLPVKKIKEYLNNHT